MGLLDSTLRSLRKAGGERRAAHNFVLPDHRSPDFCATLAENGVIPLNGKLICSAS